MNAPARRTQRERRESTIQKLLNATIECLVEHGYRDTSIGRISTAAGVSHGGLFRHFSSRTALIAAATDEIGLQHIGRLEQRLTDAPPLPEMLEALVAYFRQATRDPLSCAWREVMVAARSDTELREAVAPAVQRFEGAVMRISAQVSGATTDDGAFGTLVLSLLHMFDSEATTAVIFANEELERIRHRWAVGLLRNALHGAKTSSA